MFEPGTHIRARRYLSQMPVPYWYHGICASDSDVVACQS